MFPDQIGGEISFYWDALNVTITVLRDGIGNFNALFGTRSARHLHWPNHERRGCRNDIPNADIFAVYSQQHQMPNRIRAFVEFIALHVGCASGEFV